MVFRVLDLSAMLLCVFLKSSGERDNEALCASVGLVREIGMSMRWRRVCVSSDNTIRGYHDAMWDYEKECRIADEAATLMLYEPVEMERIY